MEGERVCLRNCNLKGEVSEWLVALEEGMKKSLNLLMKKAMLNYDQEKMTLSKWIPEFPS